MSVPDIDRYFDSPVVEWDREDDPNWLLKWWKANQELYPLMSRVARDYLAVQSSEVSVERLFSKGRDMIGLRRHSLSPETMKAIMVSRDAYHT
jgi:hAT family protein